MAAIHDAMRPDRRSAIVGLALAASPIAATAKDAANPVPSQCPRSSRRPAARPAAESTITTSPRSSSRDQE